MPKTDEQLKQVREKTKKLILSVSLKLFASNGFHNTSIAKIAKEANIAKGLLYNYFNNKDELLEAIIVGGINDVIGSIKQPETDGFRSSELLKLVDTLFELIKNRLDFWKLYFSILLQPEATKIKNEQFHLLTNHTVRLFLPYFHNEDEKSLEKAKVFGVLVHGAILNYVFNPDEELLELLKKEVIISYI